MFLANHLSIQSTSKKIKEEVTVDNKKPRQIELINKRIAELSAQMSRYSEKIAFVLQSKNRYIKLYLTGLLRYALSGVIEK